jgi:hypothetical protein
MKKLAIIFSILLFSTFVCGQTKYKTYHNARFGYSISYPSDLLAPNKEEDMPASGKIFLSKDRNVAEMRVFAHFNALFHTLDEQFKEDLKSYGAEKVTYKVLLKNSFVISGIKDGKIFYQKTLFRRIKEDLEVFYTFTIEYKESERQKYDSAVRKIVESFRFDPKADV